MKPVKTPGSNVVLTLTGPDGERIPDHDLPAQRYLAFDSDAGQTEKDARLVFETIWQPNDDEARRLEAGACIRLTVWGQQHPAVGMGVTDAVVPERELIDRGHVDTALGHLYGQLQEHIAGVLPALDADGLRAEMLPEPSVFADLWIAAVAATRPGAENGDGANHDGGLGG